MTATKPEDPGHDQLQLEGLDPVTFSVVLSRLGSIAREMTASLEHAAMTPLLALCRDYSCCIYDRGARQVAMVDALPIHTNSMRLVLEEIARFFVDDVNDGDVIACNDPYHGNTHIGDLVTACPVFIDGELCFWTATRGHQLDVGAPIPTSDQPWARDVWQEGLILPPIKLYAHGEPRRDVIELYLANVRYRDLLEGDLLAQIGSVWTGARRLRELCDELGVEAVLRYSDHAVEYAARRTAAELATMPAGTYSGEAWLDAASNDVRDVSIGATVTIGCGRVSVAFSGPPQAASSRNASLAVQQAAGSIPVLTAIDPDIPHNEGCLRQIDVVAPEGSLCHASYPTATASATTIPGDAMQDAVARALACAVPERVAAGSAHWSNTPMLSGNDAESGVRWGHLLLNGGGGGGAALGADGWPLITTPACQGGLKTASVEHTELLYPLRFHEWEIEPESMGLGRWLGGPGIRCSVSPTELPIEFISVTDGLTNPPFGLAGGTPGAGGGSFVTERDGQRSFLGSAYRVVLDKTQIWTGVSSGGGGYGSPLTRDLELVARDVRDGFYSRETALTVFGVVLREDGNVDRRASDSRRAELRAEQEDRPPVVSLPTEPAASDWRARQMRPRDRLFEHFDLAW
jgi:N-methylhydantoinase B